MSNNILGFSCSLNDTEVRKAIRQVLKRILESAPEDFKRLRWRVLDFRWFPEEEVEDGNKGHFDAKQPSELPPEAEGPAYRIIDEHNWPGEIKISRELTGSRLIAIIAHELGHAATRSEDSQRRLHRNEFPRKHWVDEACANKYAFKWGFSKQIRKEQKSRDPNRSLILPGQTIPFGGDVYKMTPNFYLRKVVSYKKREGQGDLDRAYLPDR